MKKVFLGLILLLGPVAWAQAHFLWILVDRESEPAAVNVFFEHALKIEDGHYIPHFIKRGKTWIQDGGGLRELPVKDTRKDDRRWLSAELDASPPCSITSYGLFGVYRYGKEDVQLHYYAKHIDAGSREALSALGRSENLDLDIVPEQAEDGTVTLTVLWRGEPAAGRKLTVRGPTRLDLKTDARGVVSFVPAKPGLHSFLTSVEEETPGTDPVDQKDYVKIRHQSTLTMRFEKEPE